ncbi:MAG: hypothetical protein RL885_30695 [Planctomycetota bacterium]
MSTSTRDLDERLTRALQALPGDQPADLDILMKSGREWVASQRPVDPESQVALWLKEHDGARELDAVCGFLAGVWMAHAARSENLVADLLDRSALADALSDDRYRDMVTSTLCHAATPSPGSHTRARLRERLEEIRVRFGDRLQRPVSRTLDATLAELE